MLNLKLMENNISREDLDCLIDFLKGDPMPILTQSKNVIAFEEEWSKWLGVKHSVFVNSGASANLITMAAVKHHFGPGEVIVPTLTWISDIASVLQNGLDPVFVDIDPRHLGMATKQILQKITPKTRAVFLTHVLGYNALTKELVDELAKRNIPLIEDVCESHGAEFAGRRLGSHGLMSNFSFYFAHHMTTIEGGMVCTNDDKLYQTLRMLRSHGMLRECSDAQFKSDFIAKHPDLNPEFVFVYPAYNVRSTELNAVIGRHQLKSLDKNNDKRVANLNLFLKNLNPNKYRTDFETAGAVNYAFTLILKEKDEALMKGVCAALQENKVEYRRGTAGGGNQLRQPYLKNILRNIDLKNFPEVDHVHFFGMYIGNFPQLEQKKILGLCELLNSVE